MIDFLSPALGTKVINYLPRLQINITVTTSPHHNLNTHLRWHWNCQMLDKHLTECWFLHLEKHIITWKFNSLVFELYLTIDTNQTRRHQLLSTEGQHHLQSKLHTKWMRFSCYLIAKSFTTILKYLYIMYWTQVSLRGSVLKDKPTPSIMSPLCNILRITNLSFSLEEQTVNAASDSDYVVRPPQTY